MGIEHTLKDRQKCGTCRFCEPKDVRMGLCRVAHPTILPMPARHAITGQQGMRIDSHYPPVELEDRGCGEYLPKLSGA